MNTIEKLDEDEYAVLYRTSCRCFGEDHTMDIEIEVDRYSKLSIPEMNLYFKVYGPCPYSWVGEHWFSRFWKRVKGAVQVFCKGEIHYQECFSFRGEPHISDFLKAIKEGLEHIKIQIEYPEDNNYGLRNE